jgi:D-tyrosyl-tRNA(Tyr) deacylase
MRAVIQRVSKAAVKVDDVTIGTIGIGLLVFLGVEKKDTTEDIEWLAAKIPSLRVFEDDGGRMNRSVLDITGNILVISQFTLYGNMRKGTRPSFNHAANPEKGKADYESFVDCLSKYIEKPVQTGKFGAYMQIEAIHDGPVTLILDTKNKIF